MIKNIWANLSYILFITILIIIGFLCGDLKVYAQTVNSWSSNQVKINTCDGNGTCTDSSNYDGNHTFGTSDLAYPINFIQWRLKASSGLSKENYYTFTFGYKPTPDAIYPDGLPTFKKTGDYAVENISCNTSTNNGYYLWTCSFEPRENYSSNEYLYVRINFYDGYLTKIVSSMSGYKVMQGVSGTITDSTNTIINNNNQNTQEIINNQNENTDKQIESQQVCSVYYYSDNFFDETVYGFLRPDGSFFSYQNWRVSQYINIHNGSNLKMVSALNSSTLSGTGLCFYKEDKTLISCIAQNTLTQNSIISIPNNSYYMRYSYSLTSNIPKFSIELCKNGNQSISDSISDDSVDDPSDMLEDFEDLIPTNGVITHLIALPITLYTKVLNSINGTCQQFNLGSLYNTNLIIPCIDVSTYLGSTLWNLIDLIISGAFVLIIAKKMIKAFENFTSMKEGDVINND